MFWGGVTIPERKTYHFAGGEKNHTRQHSSQCAKTHCRACHNPMVMVHEDWVVTTTGTNPKGPWLGKGEKPTNICWF